MAIDAVEIANLVRIEIDADADTLAAARNDGVDVQILLERSTMIPMDQRNSAR